MLIWNLSKFTSTNLLIYSETEKKTRPAYPIQQQPHFFNFEVYPRRIILDPMKSQHTHSKLLSSPYPLPTPPHLTGVMVRTSVTTLYYNSSPNTRFPNPSLNLQFCHNATKLLSLKAPFPLINRYPFLQYSHLHHKNPTSSAVHFRSLVIKASSSMASSTETKPFAVLFVCLGNICRSPAAEGVFTDIVNKRGLDSKFKIDSAGTINYHEGNPADSRMRAASKRRGIEITSISRPIRPSDFRDFDIILAMDNQNREDIMEAFNKWKFKETLPDDARKKVKLMCSFCKKHDETEVPDPYYGGPQGFEKVLDLLEDACESLLDSILAEKN